MKSLAWLLAIVAAAVALALLGRLDHGYVLFIHPPYRVEVSLVFFAIAALAAFFAGYAVVRLLSHALSLPAYVRAFRARRRRERAQGALAAALQAFYEGRYSRAEKEAAAAFEGGAAPGVAALLAARAAHQLRDVARRESWLARAAAAGRHVQGACLVTRAELALDERDYASAREALRALQESGARHIASQRLLLRAERGAGAWEEVLRLAGQLAKRDALPPGLADEYRTQATVELLARAGGDAAAFERRWRAVEARDQVRPRIAAAAATQAAAAGSVRLAGEILERALAAEWTPGLVALYGELPERLPASVLLPEARRRIEVAERWLLQRSRDAELLAALGRLCVDAELWGKARSFLEASLSFHDGRAARLELARLAEKLGQAGEAQQHYRRAAELA